MCITTASATAPIPSSSLPTFDPAGTDPSPLIQGVAKDRAQWLSLCHSFTEDQWWLLWLLFLLTCINRSQIFFKLSNGGSQERGKWGEEPQKNPMSSNLVGNQVKKTNQLSHCKQIPPPIKGFLDQPSHKSSSPTPSRTGWPRQQNIQQIVLLPLLGGKHLLKNSQMNLEWSIGHFVMLMTVTNCLFFILKCWLIVSWGETRQLACALQSFRTHPNYSCEDTLIWRDTVCGYY